MSASLMLTNRSETSKEAHPKTDQSTGGNPNKKGSVVPSQAFFLITLSFLKFIVVLLTCAAIVYYGVLHTETIPIWIALPISFVIGLVVSVLFVFNDTARCVVALALAKLTAPEARALILTAIAGYVIAGPCVSIVYNLNQVHKTVQCTADLVKNQSTQLQSVYKAAFQDTTDRISDAINEWEDIGRAIDSAISPVRNGLGIAIEQVTNIREHIEAINNQCYNGIQKTKQDCENGIGKAYEECKAKIPSFASIKGHFENIGNQVAKPFQNLFGRRRRSTSNDNQKRVRVARSAPQDLQNICKPLDISSTCGTLFKQDVLCAPLRLKNLPDFRSLESVLNDALNTFSFSIAPKPKADHNEISSNGNLPEVFEKFTSDFKEGIELTSYILEIIRIVLSIPLLLFPFITSYFYLRKYRSLALSGNTSKLTKFFKQDDLKNRRVIGYQVLIFALHLLLMASIFVVDFVLYSVQNVLKTHGGTNITATGSLELKFDIKSGPIFEPIVTKFIDKLEQEQSYKMFLSSEQCLPDPMKPQSRDLILVVSIMYWICLVTFVTQFFTGTICKKIVSNFDKPIGK